MSQATDTPNLTPGAASDRLTRFMIDRAGVRGAHVDLQETWQHIRKLMADVAAHAPGAVELLGEATAAAALFTGHIKIDGRLSVQLRSSGLLRTLFVECTSAGTLRGIVRLDPEHEGGDSPDASGITGNLRDLGEDAVLAITIENPSVGGRDPVRYQGMVALDADSLGDAFEGHFRQSEQLPTRLLLAGNDERVAGLMLQKLPGDEGDQDGWTRAGALFDTLGRNELLGVPVEELLNRLFHEDGVQMMGDRPLSFACSCSVERVESMLVSLGSDEAMAAADDGEAQIRCEFCGADYRFTRDRIQDLLDIHAQQVAPPDRLQ
ncbi:Hsp33 family molecular chaperone HslO [Lysobacter sp. H23M47]|uniref:Hsp33 family molecular chaperone HslO n=1 Tax=Lysobacter sp. H23M47 TaxID=2781024 RepID=UPI001881CA46|nr:Hsp33 family molecular chaperone HslO [Lysobacter sp. H23M47]